MSSRKNEFLKKNLNSIIIFALALIIITVTIVFIKNLSLNKEFNQMKTMLAAEQEANSELQEKLNSVKVEFDDASFDYQKKYPNMYVQENPPYKEVTGKDVYLTFDDGPSANTYTILDTLDKYNAKATFFVAGKNIAGREDALKRMVASGHEIAIHTYSHDYKEIYQSIDAFLDDFNKTYEKIYEVTGVYPKVFRFPGGSINAYNKDIYQPLIAEMLRRGFVYYDWNVSSEDATGRKYTAQQLANNVLAVAPKYDEPIVLMHDAGDKQTTAAALPIMLEGLKNQGYNFAVLDKTVKMMTFGYK